MRSTCHVRVVLTAIFFLPMSAWGQEPASFPGPAGADPAQGPLPALAGSTADNSPAVAAQVEGFLRQTKFDATWLASGGSNGLGMRNFELSATVGVPLAEGWAPLLITPYAAAHLWERPVGGAAPDLPPSLYDLNVEIGWRPRLAPWLFADVAVTPGVYTDFNDIVSDSFQMRGRGLAIVALSPRLQFVGGGMYVNRNKTKFLPAGGVIWNPAEDTRCFFVFPQPKLSHHFFTAGNVEWWGYAAGEFGGGRWSVDRAGGAHDSLDYTDLRVNVGVEALSARGVYGHAEIGYVFWRRVNFASDTPDFEPLDTVMVRVGFSF